MNRRARLFLICCAVIVAVALIAWLARNMPRCPDVAASVKIGGKMLVAGCE